LRNADVVKQRWHGLTGMLKSRECSAVPIAGYFTVVGAALALLLLIASWSLPETPARFSDHPEVIERAAIRIRSERKWPEKVVFDTSKTAMVPSDVGDSPPAQASVSIPSDEAPRQSNLDAMARLEPDARPAAVDHPALQSRRGGARTVRSGRVARAPIVRRLARAETGWSCCQFDKGQAGSNAIPFRRAASSWLFE
jgi:hypothetical protein